MRIFFQLSIWAAISKNNLRPTIGYVNVVFFSVECIPLTNDNSCLAVSFSQQDMSKEAGMMLYLGFRSGVVAEVGEINS